MKIILSPLYLMLLMSLLACQKSQFKELTPATKLRQGPTAADADLETLDVNNDKRLDTWLYFSGSGDNRALVQRRSDLNFDGKVDITQYFQSGQLSQEEVDLDFDGHVDMRSHYVNGVIERRELDFGFDGRTDLWMLYKSGQLQEKQRDSNYDGKPDIWEYYEADKLTRRGRDINFDGKVDVWEKP